MAISDHRPTTGSDHRPRRERAYQARVRDMNSRHRDLLTPGVPCRDCMSVALPVAGGPFVATGRLLSGIPRHRTTPRRAGARRSWWRLPRRQ
jgi:hypothetical protein